jgi:membrane-bound ClpP family serine protease
MLIWMRTHISMMAPGKKGASTNPRKNRVTTSPEKEVTAAWQAEITPL